jgi:hypothetical protein
MRGKGENIGDPLAAKVSVPSASAGAGLPGSQALEVGGP